MRISITGTPGTGKTSVSRRVSDRLDLDYVSVNELARDRGCIKDMDEERDTEIVDIDCLKQQASECKDCVFDGHLSHFLDSDHVFVLRCEPEKLRERLAGKGWKESKVQENVDAEVIGVIDSESRKENDNVYSVDTSERSVEEVVDIVEGAVKGKLQKDEIQDEIDWMDEW
ncbi:MAG: adenylate kinase family protein [Candidatus Aenigmatarchaeota archaeon]